MDEHAWRAAQFEAYRTHLRLHGRFFETRWSPEAVILSAAKDLRLARREILRCAQNDTSQLRMTHPTLLAPFLKNLPV